MNTQRFIVQALGIFSLYFIFGILQEKITKTNYHFEVVNEQDQKQQVSERFTYFLTLVFVNCICVYVGSLIYLRIRPSSAVGDHKSNSINFYYGLIAMTYLLGMVSSNMALQWVSYPTQVVGKAAKPIPVLILGVLVGNKHYSLRKYVFIFLIVTGVVMFMYKEQKKATVDVSFGLGELMLILSLVMDGLTGGFQERIRAESKPSGAVMMMKTNAWASVFSLSAVLITGEFLQFIPFAQRHPYVLLSLLLIGVTQAVGQCFLYAMLVDFGPLVVAVVTTTRKFFTVLFSVLVFGNAITTQQWIGVVLVFSGLFLDAYYKSPPTPNANKKAAVCCKQ